MSLLLPALFNQKTAVEIENSAVLVAENQQYLTRSGVAGDRQKFTIHFTFKRPVFGERQVIYQQRANADSSQQFYIAFEAGDHIRVLDQNGEVNQTLLDTIAKFRDTASHYAITVVVDTTQSTESDRVKLFVNSKRITEFDTAIYCAQNYQTAVGTTARILLGCQRPNLSSTLNAYSTGYWSRFFLVDRAVSPDTFIEVDENTGQLNHKNYAGSFGANGFLLEFEDPSNLGLDTSGNGNHFTNVNGVTQSTDTPTNNHAILNALDSIGDISNAGRTGTNTATAPRTTASGFILDAGKWYWEVNVDSISNQRALIGLVSADFDTQSNSTVIALAPDSVMYFSNQGEKWINGIDTAYGEAFVAGDVVGVAVNFDDNEIEFFKNGVSQGVITTKLFNGKYKPFLGNGSQGTSQLTLVSEQDGWSYSAPASFVSLSTKNLPTPSFKPSNVFVAVTDTEDNIEATLAAARSNWSGNRVDILKNRDANETWAWQFSHDAANEYAVASSVTHQAKRSLSGSDNWVGYSIRDGIQYGTKIGEILSHPGGAATVTTNIGVARQAILLFPRNGGDIYFYHPDLAAGQLTRLNENGTTITSDAINTVTATSFDINVAAGNYDYIVLADSAAIDIGGYTGNGNADGTFVNMGFSPALFIVSIANVVSDFIAISSLFANPPPSIKIGSDAAENPNEKIDMVSNGIKTRNSAGGVNNSNGDFIYIAFAGKFFKHANAR